MYIRCSIRKVGNSFHAETRTKSVYSIHSTPVKAVQCIADHEHPALGDSIIVAHPQENGYIICPVNQLLFRGQPMWQHTDIGKMILEQQAQITHA